MNAVTLITTCSLLVVGWATGSRPVAIAGGGLFLVREVVCIAWAFRAALFYRNGRHEEWHRDRSTFQKIVDGLWCWLAIVGLICIIVGDATSNEAVAISGWMMWIGRIVSWFVCGIIAKEVAGIPLKMTYGGWQADHPRRQR